MQNVRVNQRELRVMNITIKVPEGTPINSPTAELSFEDLNALPRLPGRNRDGFEGGTAIVIGTPDPNDPNAIIADDVFVEPAENVVLGTVGPGLSTILDVPVVFLTDSRIPSTAINSFGFEIDPADVQGGEFGGVEGYFAGGTLYVHTAEVDGPIPPASNPDQPQVSVLRVRCDPGGRIEVRGGAYVPSGNANNTIVVRNLDTRTNFGSTQAEPDEEGSPQFGEYRFREDVETCPNRIRVIMRVPGQRNPRVNVNL
ncbi:hypothetical protein [Sphaerothrix gracilis]|uniref:hypothetical protein n=1 Tax=Sphaerothrix gracilis TaxID=3151835 RepID=UPI0031FBBE27